MEKLILGIALALLLGPAHAEQVPQTLVQTSGRMVADGVSRYVPFRSRMKWLGVCVAIALGMVAVGGDLDDTSADKDKDKNEKNTSKDTKEEGTVARR